jgi:UDP-2,3-diacylglucosamine hydrolase
MSIDLPMPMPMPIDHSAHRSLPRETLFVSDLHLTPERPGTVELFLQFLADRARRAERLFILGDLYEAWIGDDDDTPPYPEVRRALRALTASGTACTLLHGNRDFLIGRGFCRETGCTLRPEPALIELDGQPILLMHGDLLCTDDTDYLRFRRKVRNPVVKRLFLWKSLAARRAIAERHRRNSRTATAVKPEDLTDASPQAITDYVKRFRANRLVHGHTHRPADHEHVITGRTVIRSVLAQWFPERGEVLVHRAGHWHREVVGRSSRRTITG